MTDRPLVGISTCLLGENVRYDGGHKLDRYLRDVLGRYVAFVPVCPEVECGMGVPREAVRLVEKDNEIKLVTRQTGMDMTQRMKAWMGPRLDALSGMNLCGFIFKSRSPSSGLMRVKVYKASGAANNGVGVFAAGFTARFPLLPVEEDGRLQDAGLRENFIERIFVMHRWHELEGKQIALKNLMDFHASHKYLLMAHCPKTLKELGALLAHGKAYSLPELYAAYFEAFIVALKKIATIKKNTNVLMHMMGYFKKELGWDEKAELKGLIGHYHDGLVPLIVPVTLMNHYVRKYQSAYLFDQLFLQPHPMELLPYIVRP
jgi:uncharacterized protein YbgA (DUF1722 family)/uncharacterized protein YbbK (DUF523 family)